MTRWTTDAPWRSPPPWPYGADLYRALAAGVRGVLPVAPSAPRPASSPSVITKTGLGQSLADLLVVRRARSSPNPTAVLILTALFAAVALAVLGLAVPVTASFIIGWVDHRPGAADAGRQPAPRRRCSSSTTRCCPR